MLSHNPCGRRLKTKIVGDIDWYLVQLTGSGMCAHLEKYTTSCGFVHSFRGMGRQSFQLRFYIWSNMRCMELLEWITFS